jgi:cytochrome b561
MTSAVSPAPPIAPPRRYHPVQVTLHWLIAILVLITPLLVAEGEGRRQAASIGGIPTIGVHMILGLSVLALLLVRLVVRFAIRRPEWATAGNAFFDFIGRWTHIGLYFFTFAVTITGLIFAIQTNRLSAVLGRATLGQTGPAIRQPGQFPPPGLQPGGEGGEGGGFRGGVRAVGAFIFRAFHELSWQILLLLIILHVGAALYHQFIRRDNLLGRMWYGSST